MKTLLILFALTCFVGFAQERQVTINFNSSYEIIPLKKGKAFKIPIKLHLEGGYVPKNKDSVIVTFITGMKELNLFIESKSLIINNSMIVDSISFKQNSLSSFKLDDLLDSISKKNKKFTIKIDSISKNKFIVRNDSLNDTIKVELGKVEKTIFLEEEKESFADKNEYNFYLGTNFDLKDKFDTNSFYSEIDVFLPNLFFTNSKKEKRGGLRAGIFKNNSVSSLKEQAFESDAFEIIENSADSDSITFEKKRVVRTPKVSYENLGLYFEVLFEITPLGNKNFQAFLAAHSEVIQRRETTEFDTEDFLNMGRETIHRDSISTKLRALFSINRERTRTYYNSYFGVGVPMKYTNSGFEVFLNPVLGVGDSAPYRRGDKSIKPFGIFQFCMKEKKHGIKLSGDIRKYFNAEQNPFIVINLSKSINIESLFDSNK